MAKVRRADVSFLIRNAEQIEPDQRAKLLAAFGQPPLAWDDLGFEDITTGDYREGSRLLGDMMLAGCPLHVEVIEVGTGDDGCQVPLSDPGNYERLCASDPGGAFHTVEHEGRSYVLFITPYQQ